MMFATVYRKRRRRGIQYIRDNAALFCIKNISFDMQENKAEAARLIKAYCNKWGENWTHYALWRGWPFKDSKQVTGIFPIPKRK